MSQIYYISKKDVLDKNTLINGIYANDKTNYYYSDDYSVEFYILLARAGFINISIEDNGIQYLLPEMQFEYAVLDFKNLHISKKVKKLLKKDNLYTFSVNNSFIEVLDSIENYHDNNWVSGKYRTLLEKLHQIDMGDAFKVMSIELRCKKTNKLVAGEIGYKVGKTYTSLSGFSSNDKKYNNWGKLQLVLLSNYLENNNYAFWNLGQAFMQYKIDLGAKVTPRIEFLSMFLKEI